MGRGTAKSTFDGFRLAFCGNPFGLVLACFAPPHRPENWVPKQVRQLLIARYDRDFIRV